MGEWTPLDDVGRSEAAIVHGMRRHAEAWKHVQIARDRTLASFDGLFAKLNDGKVDWSEATDEEARQMMEALDTIHAVRDTIAGLPDRLRPS